MYIWVAPRLKQQQSNPHPSPIDNRMADLSASNLAMKEKMLTWGLSQSADFLRRSGNEHNSAYRQFPVDVFVGFLSSVRSMLCADIQKQTERGHMKRVNRLDRFASIPAVCHKKQSCMFRFISTPWAIYSRRLRWVLAAMSIAPPIASFLSMRS